MALDGAAVRSTFFFLANPVGPAKTKRPGPHEAHTRGNPVSPESLAAAAAVGAHGATSAAAAAAAVGAHSATSAARAASAAVGAHGVYLGGDGSVELQRSTRRRRAQPLRRRPESADGGGGGKQLERRRQCLMLPIGGSVGRSAARRGSSGAAARRGSSGAAALGRNGGGVWRWQRKLTR